MQSVLCCVARSYLDIKRVCLPIVGTTLHLYVCSLCSEPFIMLEVTELHELCNKIFIEKKHRPVDIGGMPV